MLGAERLDQLQVLGLRARLHEHAQMRLALVERLGGLNVMGQSFDKGMVLVMSLWDDHEAKMLWLDSDYPLDKSASTPGVSRGPCSTSSGDPRDVEANSPGATVIYSNIKYGPIGSTY